MGNYTELPGYFEPIDQKDYECLVGGLPDNASMVEIGCYRGKSLASIAFTIIRKNITVLAVDIFDVVAVPGYNDVANVTGMYEDFKETIELSGLNGYVHTFVGRSVDAARSQTGPFNLVFIDGDHSYEAIKSDIAAWWPLVKDGGVLCGHDYRDHVQRAVDEKFVPTLGESSIWSVIKK